MKLPLWALLATCFYAGVLLGLVFDPEDGAEYYSETSVDFQSTTRLYTPENSRQHTGMR
jgi:hypothetical protein